MSKVTMWRSRWRCVIKPAYSVSLLLSVNIFVWQNVLYFLNDPRTFTSHFYKGLKILYRHLSSSTGKHTIQLRWPLFQLVPVTYMIKIYFWANNLNFALYRLESAWKRKLPTELPSVNKEGRHRICQHNFK